MKIMDISLRTFCLLSCLILIGTVCPAQNPQKTVDIRFMELDSTTAGSDYPVYTLITDSSRIRVYRGWLANEPAELAIELYSHACDIVQKRHTSEPSNMIYYVALVPGGNNADVGFCLRTGTGIDSFPHIPYIKLASEDWVFNTTFLHETGHVVLSLLNNGRIVPRRGIAAISHSTAALTDRGTAFDEGFAISLETIAAQYSTDTTVRRRYGHDRFLFGFPGILSEYHRPVADLLTFAQSRTRYYDVAENNFSFAPAFKGPDYLRVQLEKSRDFSTLRDQNQLLQSEGFYASFFFSLLMRGNIVPTLDTIRQRQVRVLQILSSMFKDHACDAESPYLLYFVETYIKYFPAEAGEIAGVLTELSHGVFVSPSAVTFWKKHYLGALRLDLSERNNDTLGTALRRWKDEIVSHPDILYSRLGRQLRCEVAGISVKLVAFPDSNTLSFDVNTVEEGIIKMIPNISDAEVESWMAERAEKPYENIDDFNRRAGVRRIVREQIKFQ